MFISDKMAQAVHGGIVTEIMQNTSMAATVLVDMTHADINAPLLTPIEQ